MEPFPRRLSLFVFASLLIAAIVRAQDLTNYEKLLLPVFSNGGVTGANGTQFATRLYGYTEVDTSYYAGVVRGSGSQPGFVTQPALNPIFEALNYGPPGPSGRFLYVEKSKASDLSLQYMLVSSGPPDGTSHVTELPIVRNPLTGLSRILAIPNKVLLEWPNGQVAGEMKGYAQRNTLRIYDFDGTGSGEVEVQLFMENLFGRQGGGAKRIIKLDQRLGDDPTFPYFGQIDMNTCIPFSLHTPCIDFSFRIEITPVTTGLRYWGFVSSIDNRTNVVTIYTPQSLP
jgi:hypothetical protein